MRLSSTIMTQQSNRAVDRYRPFYSHGMPDPNTRSAQGAVLPCPFGGPMRRGRPGRDMLGQEPDPTADTTDTTGSQITAPTTTAPKKPDTTEARAILDPWYKQKLAMKSPEFTAGQIAAITFLSDNAECFFDAAKQQKYTSPPSDCKDKWSHLFGTLLKDPDDLAFILEFEPFVPPTSVLTGSAVQQIQAKRKAAGKPPLKIPTPSATVAPPIVSKPGPSGVFYLGVATAIGVAAYIIYADKEKKARVDNPRRKRKANPRRKRR